MAAQAEPQDEGHRYKIGAVERLTGIPASSIRIWERRHAAVTPERSESGTRYYSDEDVERLRIMRELTENGDSISEVARLALDELRQRRQEFAGTGAGGGAAVLRRILFAGFFDDRVRRLVSAHDGFDEVAYFDNAEAVLRAGASTELLVLDHANLHRDQLSALHELRRQVGAKLMIIVYRFAAADCLAALAVPEIRLVRGPLTPEDLLDRLLTVPDDVPAVSRFESALSRPVSPPQFSAEQLARVTALDSAVRCECPNHLAGLIRDLQAFEQYSAECESRSAGDERFHARLHRGTAACREIMETLLREALDHEGIRL